MDKAFLSLSPMGEGWGEDLGCELQLTTFVVECHPHTVET